MTCICGCKEQDHDIAWMDGARSCIPCMKCDCENYCNEDYAELSDKTKEALVVRLKEVKDGKVITTEELKERLFK